MKLGDPYQRRSGDILSLRAALDWRHGPSSDQGLGPNQQAPCSYKIRLRLQQGLLGSALPYPGVDEEEVQVLPLQLGRQGLQRAVCRRVLKWPLEALQAHVVAMPAEQCGIV